MDKRVDASIGTDGRADGTWGTVALVSADSRLASVYIYGASDYADGFRVPDWAHVKVGDRVRVSMNKQTREFQIVDVWGATPYQRLALDHDTGSIYTGDGTVAPTSGTTGYVLTRQSDGSAKWAAATGGGGGGVSLSTSAASSLGSVAAAGSGTTASPYDHVHPYPTAAQVGAATSGHTHTGTYEPSGAVSTHEGLSDPHPQYLTSTEGNAAYATSGHNHTGTYANSTHTHAESDVTSLVSDLAGKAAASHTHTQSESHNSPDTDTATTSLHHTIGTGANQAAAGNHSHTAYASTTHASTHAAAGSDPVTISPSQVSGTAVITTDSRLSDARTPTAHKTSHATGGSDALSASDIGAAASSHSHTATDVSSILTSTTPSSVGGSNVVGTASTAARADHVHAGASGVSLTSTAPASVGTTNTVGTGSAAAREDHIHAGVTSITGTANQVTASASNGAVTLSLPQSIDTAATPTLSKLTLSSTATDALSVAGGIKVATAGNDPGVYVGDDSLIFDADLADTMGIQGQQTATNGGIVFGSGKDTNIYRSAANTLKTDDSLVVSGGLTVANNFAITTPVSGSYDKAGSADSTTITTAGTYYALTSAEVSFTPQFVGQRFLIAMTGYVSLNTTTVQYAFVRSDITDSSNNQITALGFTRAENWGTSGRGTTVAFTKIWTADSTSARKYKLYGTTQTSNGLSLSLAYTQMTVMSLN